MAAGVFSKSPAAAADTHNQIQLVSIRIGLNFRITAMTFVFGWETPVGYARGKISDFNAVRDSYQNSVGCKQQAPSDNKAAQMC